MEHLKEAVRIVEAQASVRAMTAEEACDMVARLSKGIRELADGGRITFDQAPTMDPKRAIRTKSIMCLECGRSFKTLSRKHLAAHGLTPEEYRAKWGYPARMPLSCRETAKARSERMKGMKLWTRTGAGKGRAKDLGEAGLKEGHEPEVKPQSDAEGRRPRKVKLGGVES